MEKRNRILNAIGYVIMVVVNILAVALPLNGKTTGEISSNINSLFTPAPYTFMIWGLIYILLLGFVIYGLLPKQKQNVCIDSIGITFFISSILNALWLFAWHYEKLWLSLIIMILLLFTLIKIYNRVNKNCVKNGDNKFVRIPFSIYLAWISIATIANVSVVLKATGWNGLGLSETVWTIIVLVFALILSLYVSIKNDDLVYLLTTAWALIGILVRHWGSNTPISITVIAAVIVIIIQIICSARKK
ncbi:tryptophan-rich sensory protein [Vallitalea guaymasensis]|uniref:Tryptophan-rich sensory protein n=1 Tax=Vallitalea guaymasensis TaxID=1185412 RepID=A0A8J8MD49_9FIRM|nr:tryptophan-rich sensory protein [Vallitalea guaymasensis]QUH30613.1 tryptophan-rich sensory protein [Vallitalea guaymasensis]